MTRGFLALWCAVYTALAVVVTFPLVAHLSSVVPHDLGDPLLSTSILWWNAHVVPLTARWWDGFAFFPATGMMAFSDHRLGTSLIASPLQWLGCGPLAAYNLTLLATFPLCAIAAHGLAFTLTRRHDASLVCGLAYGFNPYRVAHIEHLELLAAFAMPAALAALHLYVADRKMKWLVAFGLALLLQALCASYYFLFFGIVLALWMLWFIRWRDRQIVFAIAAAGACSVAVLSPIVINYQRIHHHYGFSRGIDEIILYSADVTSFATASPFVRFWGWTSQLNGTERQLFPGLTIVALALAGALLAMREQQRSDRISYRAAIAFAALASIFVGVALSAILLGPWRVAAGPLTFSVGAAFKPFSLAVMFLIAGIAALPQTREAYRRQSPFAFYVLLTAVLVVLSLGPKPTFLGIPILYRAPYTWLMALPIFADGVRVPARFAMLVVLALSVSGALAFNRLQASEWTRRVLLLAAGIGIVADGWMGTLPMPASPDMWPIPEGQRFAAVFELPMTGFQQFIAMYRSTRHRHPTVDGQSGYIPPHYHILETAIRERDPGALDGVAASGPLLVVVDKRDDPDGQWSQFVKSDPRATPTGQDERWAFFNIPQTPVTGCGGSALAISAVSDDRGTVALKKVTDGDRFTWWGSPEPQTKGDFFLLDLARPARPCEVALSLGPYLDGYPRALRVETSLDGTSWQTAFVGRGAGLALRGALEAPRSVPIRIPIASGPARFVRLTLLESTTEFPWMITEVAVSGAPF
jgi:hypothetical protein